MTDLTELHAVHPAPPPVERHAHYGPAMPSRRWVPAPRYLMRRDRVLRHAMKLRPRRILDIGCGPAALLSELAERGAEACGVDRSADALRLARLLNRPNAAMTLQAELDLAWKGTFDLVMSFEVIEHLDDDVAALQDWRDYLTPGGRIILSTPAHPSRWNAADVWAGHVRRYTKEGLIASVTAAGYTVETIECYGFPLANLFEVWRARAYGRMLRHADKAGKCPQDLTDESGSDRSVESRFWRVFASWPVALLMRAACQVQRPFLRTEFGNGFIVVARRA